MDKVAALVLVVGLPGLGPCINACFDLPILMAFSDQNKSGFNYSSMHLVLRLCCLCCSAYMERRDREGVDFMGGEGEKRIWWTVKTSSEGYMRHGERRKQAFTVFC